MRYFLFFAALFYLSPAISSDRVKLPIGTLTVNNDADLLLDGRRFSPNINGGLGIVIYKNFQLGNNQYVLLGMQTGGNACPVVYNWLITNGRAFDLSPDFGNCAESPIVSSSKDGLTVNLPAYGTAPKSESFIKDLRLTENGKEIKTGWIKGTVATEPEISKTAKPTANNTQNKSTYKINHPTIKAYITDLLVKNQKFYGAYASVHDLNTLGRCMALISAVQNEEFDFDSAVMFSLMNSANGNLLVRYSIEGKEAQLVNNSRLAFSQLQKSQEFVAGVTKECLNRLDFAIEKSSLRFR